MKPITGATLHDVRGGVLEFLADHGSRLVVRVLDDAVVRVSLVPPGGWRLDRTWSVCPDGADLGPAGRPRDSVAGFPCPVPAVEATPDRVVVTTAALRLTIHLDPLWLEWDDAGGRPVAADRRTGAYALSRRTTAFSHAMARRPGEHHHGLGDRTGPLDRTGRRFRMDAVDPAGYDADLSDPLYKIIPFVLVDSDDGPAYGVFHDNLAPADVDLGATIDSYHGPFRRYRAEDGDLDYYFIGGPAMRDVVRRFVALTGGQAFPPKWSLGFGFSSLTLIDAPDAEARLHAFVAGCREHAVPCSAIHLGSGYSRFGIRRHVLVWNPEKFPDPAGTVRRLREAGLRVVANVKPCLLDDHPWLADATARSAFVLDRSTGRPCPTTFWDGTGYLVDFTGPGGEAWWREHLARSLTDLGVVPWDDNNEFELEDEDAEAAGAGRPFPLALNRPAQALLMTRLSTQAQLEADPAARPYVVTRAGGPGLGRYATTWSGDNRSEWNTLRGNLRQGLNMGLSGLFVTGHDVGGFLGPRPGPELLCRFVELCALWPRFVMNSWNGEEPETLPWSHPEVLPAIRSAFALRYALLPTLYTAIWAGSRDGDPPVRPVGYEFPGAGADDVFLLGRDLLVAPVLEEGAVTRTVRLPEHPGGWYCFHSGERLEGEVTVPAPPGRLPVFARAGGLVAVSRQLDTVDPATDDWRGLRVYAPGGPGVVTGELFEDDGVTRAGPHRLYRFTLRTDRASILTAEVSGAYVPAYDRVEVEPVGFAAPLTVGF